MKHKNIKLSGAAIALAAASLVGCSTTDNQQSVSATTDLVHCYGINACKGHNDCKTANNDCKGMGACKGQGYIAITKKACDDKGGEIRS